MTAVDRTTASDAEFRQRIAPFEAQDNQQRAAEVLGFRELEQAQRYARDDTERITAALDSAEARGRAEVAAKVLELHQPVGSPGAQFCGCCGEAWLCRTVAAIRRPAAHAAPTEQAGDAR